MDGATKPRLGGLRVVVAASICLLPAGSSAYSVKSAITDGCHERLTLDAIELVGWPGRGLPPSLADRHQRIASGLPVSLSGAQANPWTLAAVIGSRSNDVADVRAVDVLALAAVHADPASQAQHCLRAPADDGTDGDIAAIGRCRDFILQELEAALGPGALLDLDEEAPIALYVAYAGTVTVGVPRYGYRIGRALHALQDSFAHTLRSPDGKRIRHVLNYVDWVDAAKPSMAVDGHPHLEALDHCDGTTAARRDRYRTALAASASLLEAVVVPDGGRAGKMDRARTVLDEVLGYQSGCTASNRFCDAPELEETAGCACSTAGPRHFAELWVIALPLALAGFARRRRPRRGGPVATSTAGLIWLVSLVAPVSAWGRGPAAPQQGLTASLHLGGAYDETALAVSAQLGWRFDKSWSVGLSAEYNPWYSIDALRVDDGVFNGYASIDWSWLHHGPLALQTTAHVGMSVLLFNLVGADRGSVGPFLGVNLLGLSVRLAERLELLIYPADVRVAMPHLEGIPVIHRQYRLTVGIRWQAWNRRIRSVR